MPLSQTENGLQVRRNYFGQDYLVVESARLGEYVNCVNSGEIRNIEINGSLGYAEGDIGFLKDVEDKLEGLHLLETKVSYSAIDTLHGLKYLSFSDNGKDIVDLTNYRSLEFLAADYSQRLVGLEASVKLQTLLLFKFNPSASDLSGLTGLPQLGYLDLRQPKISSLEGIQKLSGLKKLSLSYASKITSLEHILKLDHLEELELSNCKSVEDFDVVGGLTSLKRLEIVQCGDLPSLNFLKSLTALESISIDTNVVDGDLSLLDNISMVGFTNKRHYNRRVEDYAKQKA